MANFAGHLLNGSLGEAITSDVAIRQSFYDNNPVPPSVISVVGVTGLLSGAVTDQGYSQFPVDHTGYFCPAFAELFYNRIVAFPDPVQIGNLVADKTVTLSVWNGFFNTRSLASISTTGTEGITLVGPAPPTDYGPLQEITYDLVVSVTEGPAAINGAYIFDFDGADFDLNIAVLGNRVLALPYLFQAGLLETLKWQTKVITSNDGSEQRMKLRGSPRQEFGFNIAVPRGDTAYLDALLYAWRGNNFGVPVSSECRPLTAPTSTSSPTVDVNTNFGDFRVGGLAMIYNNERDFELVTIESFTASSITSTGNISKVFGTSALVMPVRVARLLSTPSRSSTGYSSRLSAQFQVVDNTSLAVSASPLQYKGLDVYVDDQLTLDGFVEDRYESRVDVIDHGTGLVDTFAPWVKTKIQRTFGLQFEDLEDAWNHRLWLHRREGKLRPFWMPTMENNLKLLSTGTLVLQLTVVDEGQQFLMEGREDLAILTTTGWLFREILSIDKSGNDLIIGVDVDMAVAAADVETISFLGRKRLSSDNLELNWTGNDTGNTAVPVIELNN